LYFQSVVIIQGKKKPRSFLYKAKKYGVRGQYGRGKNVDEETYNYFVRVMERLKDEFEDEEEKGSGHTVSFFL
jgi:nucleolar protein 9